MRKPTPSRRADAMPTTDWDATRTLITYPSEDEDLVPYAPIVTDRKRRWLGQRWQLECLPSSAPLSALPGNITPRAALRATPSTAIPSRRRLWAPAALVAGIAGIAVLVAPPSTPVPSTVVSSTTGAAPLEPVMSTVAPRSSRLLPAECAFLSAGGWMSGLYRTDIVPPSGPSSQNHAEIAAATPHEREPLPPFTPADCLDVGSPTHPTIR
jgi:hypothetical protein